MFARCFRCRATVRATYLFLFAIVFAGTGYGWTGGASVAQDAGICPPGQAWSEIDQGCYDLELGDPVDAIYDGPALIATVPGDTYDPNQTPFAVATLPSDAINAVLTPISLLTPTPEQVGMVWVQLYDCPNGHPATNTLASYYQACSGDFGSTDNYFTLNDKNGTQYVAASYDGTLLISVWAPETVILTQAPRLSESVVYCDMDADANLKINAPEQLPIYGLGGIMLRTDQFHRVSCAWFNVARIDALPKTITADPSDIQAAQVQPTPTPVAAVGDADSSDSTTIDHLVVTRRLCAEPNDGSGSVPDVARCPVASGPLAPMKLSVNGTLMMQSSSAVLRVNGLPAGIVNLSSVPVTTMASPIMSCTTSAGESFQLPITADGSFTFDAAASQSIECDWFLIPLSE